MSLSKSTVWSAILLTCLSVLAAGAQAQSAGAQATPPGTPTPEQLRMLQQLPPSERQALLRSLGIDTSPQQATVPLEFPETVLTEEPEAEPVVPEERRLEAGDSIIVRFELPLDLNETERRERELALEEDERLARLLGSATYQLDNNGVLVLPGITRIPLAGLSELESAERITAEEPLRLFVAQVMYLPLAATGKAALEPFGYNLFEGVPSTFAPATDVPVPVDYVLGPGDEVRLQLFGNRNADYALVVSREGSVSVPEIGPIQVVGLTFAEMREELQARLDGQLIGTRASITLGQLRSIRVFVLGDVNRPGSFTVSGLSTMTNALFVSGGVNGVGSLRRVQLKRRGQLVSTLDLYDLLLRGDNSDDARLQPNDVIFVPPLGDTVAVAGEVQRPAIYELRGERSLGQVIELAGGLTATAYPGKVRIERIDTDRARSVVVADLVSSAGRGTSVRNGDVVLVDAVLEEVANSVTLAGHVHRPGSFRWYYGMRLTDLLPSMSYLKPMADRGYILIRREVQPGGPVEVLSADLAAALVNPAGEDNPLLAERDRVTVFDLELGRTAVVEPLLEELRLQATYGRPSQEVGVGGRVRAPGTYPLEPGMRVSDLLRAGANLGDSAYGLSAELTRYRVKDNAVRQAELIEIDLQSVLAGDPIADIALEPFDFLNVKEISLWRAQATVELQGEVRFPGTYPIEPGETLSSVITRAGGLTEFAFPRGSIFLREELREREREQLDRLAARLETDLATMSLQAARFDSQAAQSASVGQSILQQIGQLEPVGRLVIDLEAILDPETVAGSDVILKDQDVLIVPQFTQEVTVLGEVQYPTSHIFQTGASRDDYLGFSGGLTANADKKRIYIVRANGAVTAGSGSSKWFRRSDGREIRPGDTVVVPLDVDRMPRLVLWQNATSILFNLAVAAAAVGSL
jgi:protein involved in polysaccharide export with SLBB domain